MLSFIIVSYLVNGLSGVEIKPNEFTINTEGCKIRAYPLVSSSIQELVTRPESISPNCSEAVTLLSANDTHIWVIKDSFYKFQIFSESDFYCCYRNFSAEGNVENIAYGKCYDFTNEIKAEHDFVAVECYYGGNKIYDDVFRFKNLEKKYAKHRGDHQFNVIMMGIDSMSRKNFLRTMRKTSNFLKYKGSIQLRGYNKLGENSLYNLFPLLTGKSFSESKKVCWKGNKVNGEMCTFMWDVFRNAGFYTALAADSGAGVLGNYEPFLPFPPTDFYLQPFLYETRHLFKDRTYDYHLCMHDRYAYKELLRYVKDVVTPLRRSRLFGLFWEETVSHGHLNYPFLMDDDYVDLLKYMEKKKYLENTIVVFFSDHGTRWGEILNTEEGRQESRLPLFEVLFPLKFSRRYNFAYQNFLQNSRRLTTAFDVYETLLDLVNPSALDERYLKNRIKSLKEDAKGISLFLPVPTNRTCKSVDIPEHWCTCNSGETIAVSEKGKLFTAQYLIRHINQLLSEYPQCYRLGIDNILEVSASRNARDRERTYRTMLQAMPGGAVFEGTLVRDGPLWAVSGAVSRLNSYRGQSDCVKDPLAKLYCVCRKKPKY